MPNILETKRSEFEAKQKELGEIFQEAGDDIDLSKSTALQDFAEPAAKAGEVTRRNVELNELRKEVEDLEEVAGAQKQHQDRDKYFNEPQYPKGFHGQGDRDEQKSVGKLFVESEAFKGYTNGIGPVATLKGVEIKALFETTNGWPTESVREGRVVMSPVRPIQVYDIFPQVPIMQASAVYMRETVFNNNAAEVAEGAAYAEAELELEEQNEIVKEIGTFFPVTNVQMEDVEESEAYVNSRLPFMVMQRLDAQLINGSGAGVYIRGARNVEGRLTEPKAPDDPALSTIYKAFTQTRVTGRCMPHVVLMHPSDWQNIRLLQDANGNYIMGPPGMMIEPRVWGYPVVEADVLPIGTAIVGDFNNYAALRVRRGLDMQVSNSHGELFIQGKVAIRASIRACAVWYRPQAFCTITGL